MKKKRAPSKSGAAARPLDLLAFAAHPDDLEISCGGTLLRASRAGQRVGMIDLTGGEMGTRGTPAERIRESERARKILGAVVREQLDFGDGNLRSGRDEELELIEILRRFRPAIVLAPYPDERHPDHARTGRLVTDASFYAGLRKLDTGQPAHRPHTVVYYLQNYMLPPSVVVDITEVFEGKMDAIRAYRSQFYDPTSRQPATMIAKKSFIDLIEARARHFGGLIGVDFGEAFVTRQPPRVDDLVAAYGGREV